MKRKSIRLSLLFLVMCCLSAWNIARSQTIIFVNQSATGLATGTSWTDAFVSLQDAIAASAAGDEIWVAAGTYHPDEGTGITRGDREAAFILPAGVSVFGGFSGTEQTLDARDWISNEVVLSGDLQNDDNDNVTYDEPTRSDNSLVVVWIRQSSEGSELDGLTIADGNGFITRSKFSAGGGMRIQSPVVLRNLKIESNTARDGGGVMLDDISQGILTLRNSYFVNNEADDGGGGLAIFDSEEQRFDSLTFINNRGSLGGAVFNLSRKTALVSCVFIGNTGFQGGALWNDEHASADVINSRMIGNQAYYGGAVVNSQQAAPRGSVSIVNTVIAANSASFGGGIASFGGDLLLANSVVAFNSAVEQGGGFFHSIKDSQIGISNSIVWGNSTVGTGDQFFNRMLTPSGGGIVLSHTLTEGELPEFVTDDGNTIFSSPLFFDPDGLDEILGTSDDDFRLSAGSPAIDTGNNEALPPDSLDLDGDGVIDEPVPMDLDGNVRVFDGGSGAAVVDLGPYEFGAPPLVVAVEKQSVPTKIGLTLSQPYPNPFTDRLTVEYAGLRSHAIVLYVFDVLGRRISHETEYRTVDNNIHIITFFPGQIIPGIYLLVIDDDGRIQSRTAIKLRE